MYDNMLIVGLHVIELLPTDRTFAVIEFIKRRWNKGPVNHTVPLEPLVNCISDMWNC